MTMHGCYDGGDSHATADIPAFWDGASSLTNLSISTGTGRRGGNSLRSNAGSARTLTRMFPAVQSDFVLATAINPSVLPNSAAPLFNLLSPSGAVQCALYVTPAGTILFYRGAAAALLLTSSIGFVVGAYTHIQVKGTIHDTTGSAEIMVNGASGGSVSGVDTKAAFDAGASAFALGFPSVSGGTFDHDDPVWGDLQGSVDNDFFGDLAVVGSLPSGAGASAQFTPSTGANYAAVDDAAPSTADYVSSGTDGHKDTYAFADIPGTGTVKKVFVMPYCRKSDVGDAKSLILRARHGGIEAAADPIALGTDWRYWGQRGFEENPSTSAPWTLAEHNAAEYGFEIEV